MHQAYCDNCGCKIDHRDHREGSCALVVKVPESEPVHEGYETDNRVGNSASFDLCECCAAGIINILMDNRERLSALHSTNCEDILPMKYRCVHVKGRE